MGVRALESQMQRVKQKKWRRGKKNVNSITNYVSANANVVTTVAAANSAVSKTDMRSAFSSSEILKAEMMWTLQTVARHLGLGDLLLSDITMKTTTYSHRRRLPVKSILCRGVAT